MCNVSGILELMKVTYYSYKMKKKWTKTKIFLTPPKKDYIDLISDGNCRHL